MRFGERTVSLYRGENRGETERFCVESRRGTPPLSMGARFPTREKVLREEGVGVTSLMDLQLLKRTEKVHVPAKVGDMTMEGKNPPNTLIAMTPRGKSWLHTSGEIRPNKRREQSVRKAQIGGDKGPPNGCPIC